MVRIITDGACLGNPGPGGWAAIVNRDGEVEEIGGHEPNTTNNRMEMRAAIEGLRRVAPDEPVHIVTDSEYLLKGITQWIHGWKRRGWQTSTGSPVLNRELWEELDRLVDKRVTWEHVRGHRGHPENERADVIATSYAAKKTPPPPGTAVDEPAAPATAPKRRTLSRTSGATRATGKSPGASPDAAGPAIPAPGRAASPLGSGAARARPWGTTYLSLVAGKLQRHGTWDDCRERVHGAGGARFKKCRTLEEEIATVRSWGLSAEALRSL